MTRGVQSVKNGRFSARLTARPEVARLIDEAIARNRVPFALAGRGSVVIRSASAKQRRRRRPD